MSIERDFDVPLIGKMALREKQSQQSYRPITGVHKWFARRPGTLFRGLILAEFSEECLERAFFQANDLASRRIADPFMGGGTPLIEANRVGCDVEGLDVNPMAAWIVREEMEHVDIGAYERAAESLTVALSAEIDRYYRTCCPLYGDEDVPVSMEGQPPGQPRFEVVACIAGRGFGVRREDMKKLLLSTRGKVFTLQNMGQLMDNTRMAALRSRSDPRTR